MSSLAATQADGYYYPKDWDPSKGSLNAYQKSHPLGKRAKHLHSDRELVVRFEMPFNTQCTHCSLSIGRGVRFNARKKKVGMYFSTVIYEFRMRCTSCKKDMCIRNDPEHRGYAMTYGIRQKDETFEAADVETEVLNDIETSRKVQEDPFYRLEHENADKAAAKKRARGFEALVSVQDAQFKDDYSSNSNLRSKFRKEKKHIKSRQQEAKRLGIANVPLLEPNTSDRVKAKAVVYKAIPGANQVGRKRRTDTSSFQHFGDTVGSQLHRLKAAKRAKHSVGRRMKR